MKHVGVTITATGSYLPPRILTNHDMEALVETSDDWIRTRTGIRERRIAEEDQPTSALAAEAAKAALAQAGLSAEDLDLIMVATLSPDTPFPNTACHVQRILGADRVACFSLEAACSGFVYGFEIASALIRSGVHRRILLIGAEKMSSLLNWSDRSTCVLFGDGAGAVILSATDPENDCFLASELGADGRYSDLLHVPAGGSALPVTHEIIDQQLHRLHMTGREVFKLAVTAMVSAADKALAEAGVTREEIRWLVPHQANKRIIHAVGKRLDIPDERVFMNLQRYGNTSAATIPICLDEIARAGQIASGDKILMVAFGGGLTWGAGVLRWP
ncbi:MAG: beta-ketoacyl-ACP synthase III [Verrucomicrobiota bacterium]